MTVITESPVVTSGLVRNVDRCDSCSAEARVRVLLHKSNLPLMFCGHHYSASATTLATLAVVTHDDRDQFARTN